MWRPKGSRLEKLPLFAGLTPRELTHVDRLMTEQKVPAGSRLCYEGSPARECFIIASGRAGVSIAGRVTATLENGSVIGEMALLDGGRRSATVIAETDLDIYVIDSASFSTLLEEFPSVARAIMKMLSERLRREEVAHA